MLPKIVENSISGLVSDLVDGRFTDIAGRFGRLTAEELERGVSQYRGTLVLPPAGSRSTWDIYPLDGSSNRWGVDIPLWTREEGRSELYLFVTASAERDAVELEIDDIRVP